MIKEKDISAVYTTDILVVGAGSAGTTAAIAAGRAGKSVILVERYNFLGGISTGVLDTFYGFYMPDNTNRKIVGGIPDDMLDRLYKEKAASDRQNSFGTLGTGVTYNPETLKFVWEDMAIEAGVRILYSVCFVDVVMESNKVTGVIVHSKSGFVKIMANVVIDASGDADVAYKAGVPFEKAGDISPAQTLTTTFRIANVNEEVFQKVSKKELERLMREANQSGKFKLPREEGSIHRTPIGGVQLAIMTKMDGYDPCDIESLTLAEIEGRKQVKEYVRFLIEEVPGFENAQLVSLSTQVGIRETRRIYGEYRLTKEDVLEAKQFEDGIGKCAAPIEDHRGGKGTYWEVLPNRDAYDIPYRTLVPKDIDGMLVVGRCFSATHDAQASCRSMAQCMAMGQAAGIAGAVSIDQKIQLRNVDVKEVRRRLSDIGAII